MSDCNHEDDGEGTCLGCGHPMPKHRVIPAPNKDGTLVPVKAKPAKERMLYKETYKRGYCTFAKAVMPTFKHLDAHCKPVECNLMAAGIVKRGETQLEYQDIRVYFTV